MKRLLALFLFITACEAEVPTPEEQPVQFNAAEARKLSTESQQRAVEDVLFDIQRRASKGYTTLTIRVDSKELLDLINKVMTEMKYKVSIQQGYTEYDAYVTLAW